MKTATIMVVIALLLFSLTGCGSDSNQAAPGGSQVHPQAWLNPASADFHGIAFGTQGSEACTICHGLDLSGSGAVPGCDTCHFDLNNFASRVPTGSSWAHGTIPHSQFLAQGDVCNACHDAVRQFPGQGPAACHDCHVGTANHVLGQAWLDPNSATFHGSDPTVPDGCASCHGSDFLGGSAGVSCFDCHFGPTGSRIPAGSSWTHGTVPHDTLAANEAVCNACHDLNRSYGNGPTSCHDCHGTVSGHATGATWMDKSLSTFHGNSSLDCTLCHGTDLTGGTAGVSCFQCHFDAAGSRVPPGTAWNHGTSSHTQFGSNATINSVCQNCHSTNQTYGSQSNCHNCH
jgi:hypothetical protein